MTILEDILNKRKQTVQGQRRLFYEKHPESRQLPLVKYFTDKKTIICELKKASPSRGVINDSEEYSNIIKEYIKGGAQRFSVLTEQNYFKGELEHLNELKKGYPDRGFLRKDFLYNEQDIIDSYYAGADAVLLIAELLDSRQLQLLINKADEYKLHTLCEVHSQDQLQKVLSLKRLPTAIGINARNLKTFQVDVSRPLKLKPLIPQQIYTVFESGVRAEYTAFLAGSAGFSSLLIGETLMRSHDRPVLIRKITRAFDKNYQQQSFFNKLYSIKKDRYLKTCGITNLEDAIMCVDKGADILGFIMTSSKRKVGIKTILSVKKMQALKVAVVKDPGVIQRAILKLLLRLGLIDGVQLHGNETPEILKGFKGNAYKVISVSGRKDIESAQNFQPKVLYDSPKDLASNRGGIFDHQLLGDQEDIWLAGGLNPDNIGKVLGQHRVELIDVSSGIESSPGIKDKKLLDSFIKEIKSA